MLLKNFINLIRKTLKVIRAEPGIVFFTFLLDGILLIALLLFASLINSYFPDQSSILNLMNTANPTVIPLLVVFYLVVLLLIYTLFKYTILAVIRFKIKGDKWMRFSEYARLFLINLINGLALLFVLILAGLILLGVNEEFKLFVALIALIPLLWIFYCFHNLAHSFFLTEAKIRNVYENSLKYLFSKNIMLLAGIEILIIALCSMGFYLIGLFSLKNLQAPYAYDSYSLFFTITLLVLLYVFISFNRIFLVLMIKEK